MILLLSPSKTLDETSPVTVKHLTIPEFLQDSEMLTRELRGYSVAKIQKLMEVSEKIAALNHERFRNFSTPFTPKNARPALLTFKGDVYEGMSVADYRQKDFDFAQKHLRILSGLYGLLRPLDLIQPYRLEMGRKLKTTRGRDLYAFWGSRIAEAINRAAEESRSQAIINLASGEYFKSVQMDKLNFPVIDIVFKEKKGKELKIIGLFAKRARGLMADFIIRNKLKNPNNIKDFAVENYCFEPALSDDRRIVFTR